MLGLIVMHLNPDIKLIAELKEIDAAMFPMGDNYTMGEGDALHAARFLGAAMVIPMHFGTFPVLAPDAKGLQEKAEAAGITVPPLGFGESLDLCVPCPRRLPLGHAVLSS